ncbi:MAG: hypothetical protein Q8L13_09110, partial [Bradyrhizobium sp.]|uniref:hypothetical protein n=1 Tax=Bradyrhizobium sp. TaxID=376 RepID=UPI00272F855C
DLARTTFVAGPGGSTDSLAVMAYDGQAYSGNTSFSYFNVNVAGGNQAPVVTIPSANVSASAGQSIAASSLFSVSDANNDVLTYFLYDATANGGHFVVNGATVAAQTVVALSAYDLARTTFVAGPGGSSDNLRVMAYDGQAYSGNTSFSQFNVHVASAAGPVAGAQPASGDNFAFAGELGEKAVTDFSPVAAYIYAFESPVDGFNQIYGADIAAPSHAKADFGVPDAAVDLFALFARYTAGHATEHFVF